MRRIPSSLGPPRKTPGFAHPVNFFMCVVISYWMPSRFPIPSLWLGSSILSSGLPLSGWLPCRSRGPIILKLVTTSPFIDPLSDCLLCNQHDDFRVQQHLRFTDYSGIFCIPSNPSLTSIIFFHRSTATVSPSANSPADIKLATTPDFQLSTIRRLAADSFTLVFHLASRSFTFSIGFYTLALVCLVFVLKFSALMEPSPSPGSCQGISSANGAASFSTYLSNVSEAVV